MPPLDHIPARPPDDPAQDFEALTRALVTRAQEVSGAVWTDYNAHDPGVTLLEALAFAITDLGYRIDHPIGDIIASSAAASGLAEADQPLFPAHRILPSAPVTARDFRALLYDRIKGLRNAWVVAGAEPGTSDIWIQAFRPPGCDNPVEEAAQRDIQNRELVDAVTREVAGARAIASTFGRIRMVEDRWFRLTADIDIAPDANPDAVLAEILFAIDTRLNPAPRLADGEAAFPGPETIYDGPALSLGLIDPASLQDLRQDVPVDLVLDALVSPKGVAAVDEVAVDLGDAGIPPDIAAAPILDRSAEALAGLKLYRNGARVQADRDRVLSHLGYFEQRRRWEVRHAFDRHAAWQAAQRPQVRRDRPLGRYRTIRDFLPAIYGLGPEGPDTQTARAAMPGATLPQIEARTRQLKAYLLVFEQMLADMLAQFAHSATLLSFAPQKHSYHVQPLTSEPGAAARIADVLGGAGKSKDAKHPGAAPGWDTGYRAAIDQLRRERDPVIGRIDRALDHLLARFDMQIDTATLWPLQAPFDPDYPAYAAALAQRKRAVLRDLPRLTRDRALAPAGTTGADPGAVETLIEHGAAVEGSVCLVEHRMLTGAPRAHGIGDLEIDKDFRVTRGAPVDAVRLSLEGQGAIHLCLDPPWTTGWRALAMAIAQSGAANDAWSVRRLGAGAATLTLDLPGGARAHMAEVVSSPHGARRFATRLAAACTTLDPRSAQQSGALIPALLSGTSAANGVTVFAIDTRVDPESAHLSDVAAHVATHVAANVPAHLAVSTIWVTEAQMKDVRADRALLARWMDAGAGAPPDPALEAAARLRCRIHDAVCADLRREGTPA
ncbi:hypothetical protein [Pseudaestuariivita atlantica]|uniref:Uncharacterized protein n=1 Tax=Pseudaestuariivita atlantica TaxID=1317121 RepID=A0A0L1JMX9_9RHOB|nr:hypothetical protein [Pseudaestuariivita atlantica]KNG93062.1 hypothetical protein ATO11_14180 [Pseudaestuariivita atlantica]